jgi:hypothetical protein
MKNSDSHILLYAKGWYKKTDIIEDMKILVAQRYFWNKEDCTIDNIVSCCINLIYRYCILNQPEHIACYNFHNIFEDLKPDNIWKCGYASRSYTYNEAIIRKTLSMLSIVSVQKDGIKLIELDEPDEKILPLNQDVINSKRRVNG